MWFLTDLARLERERAAVEALEEAASWLEGVNWRIDQGAIVMECDIGLATGDSYRLRTTFPEHYPSAPASVRPQDLTILSSHQYGRGGELCLEIGPDNWHWDSHTTADLLRSAHRLLGDEAVAVYFERQMARILLLGIISGFPWVLIGSSLSLWLKEDGLSRSAIGWAGLIFGVYDFNIAFQGFPPIRRSGEEAANQLRDEVRAMAPAKKQPYSMR